MKQLLSVFVLAFLLISSAFAVDSKAADVAKADAQKATKKVCLDVKDKAGKEVKNKDGSVKQNCKEVKTHKKHEGTKIEDAKKK